MKPLHAVLLLLVAALVVALLAWSGEEPSATAPDVADGGQEAEAALRGADGLADDAGPTLEAPAGVPERSKHGPLLVRVLGIAGRPLPEVYVTLRPTARGASMIGKAQPTDARGELRFDDVPYDGSHQVAFFRANPYAARGEVWSKLPAAAGGDDVRVVTGAELVYRARTGLPWRVEVVDAETGQPVDGARVRFAKDDPWAAAPRRTLVMPEVGAARGFRFEIEPPAHRLVWERPHAWASISPLARALRQVHPLRREIDVTLVPRASDGGAVRAQVHRVEVAGQTSRHLTWTRDAYGRLRIRGVPFLRGELLEAEVSRENGHGRDTFWGRIPDQASGRLELPVVLSDEEAFEGPENNGTIGLGGSASSHFRARVRRPDNRLEVTVLRRDGAPAVGVTVTTPHRRGMTDARGQVVLTGVDVIRGPVPVRVREPGLLPLEQVVEMPERGTLRIELREGEGVELRVEVVDQDGLPLPFATVHVRTPSRVPWVDLDGDVQRLDEFTDHLGRRTLRHVEAGAVELFVAWGSRSATVKPEGLQPGQTRVLRVELPRPRDP